MLFLKAPVSCGKKRLCYIVLLLLHCASICMSSKSVSQILKILFQTGDFKFLSFVMSFLVDIFN